MTTITQTEAIRVLRDAIAKHLDPQWECNSNHPALAAALAATSHIAPDAAPCVICGSEEPRTGTCGSDDPRALCNFDAPDAAIEPPKYDYGPEGKGPVTLLNPISPRDAAAILPPAIAPEHSRFGSPELQAMIVAKAIAPDEIELPYRVAEFWSSANPGKKVRMLAEGDDIEQWAKRSDFIRWVDRAAIAMHRVAAAEPELFGMKVVIDDNLPTGTVEMRGANTAACSNLAAAESVPTNKSSALSGWQTAIEELTDIATKPAASEAVGVPMNQANVMPPFAAPASLVIASEHGQIALSELKAMALDAHAIAPGLWQVEGPDASSEFDPDVNISQNQDHAGYDMRINVRRVAPRKLKVGGPTWLKEEGKCLDLAEFVAMCSPEVVLALIETVEQLQASGFREGRNANDSNTNIAAPAAPTDAGVRDRADADNYRWLRDYHIGDDPEMIGLASAKKKGLDAAIAAARAKSSPQAPKQEGSES